jgi:nitrile hydratase beta subunit
VNGAQDMGGLQSFGPVLPEPDEPVFHADWERRALALTIACGGLGEWTIDMSRSARETIPPPRYLASSYYEIWLEGLTKLLAARGLVAPDEIAAGRSLHPRLSPRRPPLDADTAVAMLAKGSPAERPAHSPARFAVGDRVCTRVMNPAGHTRLPRYARGKTGVVERVCGVHVFPDANATARGEDPQWLYGVAFEGRELWGPESDPALSVSVDCWEPYLEPA